MPPGAAPRWRATSCRRAGGAEPVERLGSRSGAQGRLGRRARGGSVGGATRWLALVAQQAHRDEREQASEPGDQREALQRVAAPVVQGEVQGGVVAGFDDALE